MPRDPHAAGSLAPRRVFVDTGAWFAVQTSDDEWHDDAARTLRMLVTRAHVLVTTNHVVGETYTLLRTVSGHDAATQFLDRLDEARRVERIHVSRELEGHALRLLRRHADQAFSFVDATSFALMRAERIRHAFAFDRHFATAGFLRIPIDIPSEQL